MRNRIQADVLLQVPHGRLKLRYEKDLPARLIQYDRPDTLDAKLSQFNLMTVAEPQLLQEMLTVSLGQRGCLEKTRHLFMVDQTRLHLDEVKDLGYFFELEVCLRPDQSIEEGNVIARSLQKEFGIAQDQLMAGAYLDEQQKKSGS